MLKFGLCYVKRTLMSWVVVIPHILLLVWHRLRQLGSLLRDAAHVIFSVTFQFLEYRDRLAGLGEHIFRLAHAGVNTGSAGAGNISKTGRDVMEEILKKSSWTLSKRHRLNIQARMMHFFTEQCDGNKFKVFEARVREKGFWSRILEEVWSFWDQF